MLQEILCFSLEELAEIFMIESSNVFKLMGAGICVLT